MDKALSLRLGIVFWSAVIYWVGVAIQTYRIRTHIGRSPNIRPHGSRERLLWVGWFFVIAGWMGQPFMIKPYRGNFFFSFTDPFLNPFGLTVGIALTLSGYLGTLWSYVALGDSWRLGIRKREETNLIMHGPYQFVRHPIYLFQIIILMGVLLLLPTPFSFLILLVHLVCSYSKARDEESYLLAIHGTSYRDYLLRTGRFFPRWKTFRSGSRE